MRRVLLLAMVVLLAAMATSLAMHPVVTKTHDDVRPLEDAETGKPYLGPPVPDGYIGEPGGDTLIAPDLLMPWYEIWEVERLFQFLDAMRVKTL